MYIKFAIPKIRTMIFPGIFRKMKLPMNEKLKYVQKMVNLHAAACR